MLKINYEKSLLKKGLFPKIVFNQKFIPIEPLNKKDSRNWKVKETWIDQPP